MSDDRPSISDLQRLVGTDPFYPHRIHELQSIRNAAPVLLEIAAAALARSLAECSCGAELGCFPDCTCEVAERRLLDALAKVRP